MMDPCMTPSHDRSGAPAVAAPWTRDRLKRAILGLRRRGVPLNTKSMQNHPTVYFQSYKLFGSWEKAVSYCGIDYAAIRLRRKWTRKGILDWIRQRRTRRLEMRPGNVKKEHAGVFNAAVREFGGWYPAIRAAGIKDFEEVKLRSWDRATIMKAVRRLGSDARASDAHRQERGLVGAANYHFGSWGQARKAAGFARCAPNRPSKWTRERILQAIRGRSGTKRLTTRVFSDLGGMTTAATDMFGSWMNAVEAAELVYRKP
jgi:hypothetical protein